MRFYLTRTGLLHEPEEDKIQFSHLRFQEYLTARFIYKKVIENFFNAFEIIEREILARLTKDKFNHWSETILLFFSLNKAAANEILDKIEKELQTRKDDDERKHHFYLLLLKMLDSEEYGIKDSDMPRWVEQVVTYICALDVPTERTPNESQDSKGYSLIREFFLVY